MKKIKAFFKRLWKDEKGQSATEYILILAVMVAIIIVVSRYMPGKMKQLIDKAMEKVMTGVDKIGEGGGG